MKIASLVAALSIATLACAAEGAPPVSAAATPAEIARGIAVPYTRFTLPNGLRVVVHTDRKAPIVSVAAWYNVGSKDEPEGKTGFAHLFEHIGLFNGTENLPGGLMEPLRALGATDWNGTTWYDRTNFFQTVPTAALERTLYMESDRMGHLLGALTQERLDAQRGVVQNEKRQRDNRPFGLTGYAEAEALFPPGHPYRHDTIGSMADLDAASLEDVRQWHRDHYAPNNAVLVLAGDIDAATARTLVTRYFGDIPRGKVNRPAEAEVPTLPARVDVVLHDRVPASRLTRAWVVPGLTDAAAVDLDIAAGVLGGLASSRLDNTFVRNEQTASSVTASFEPHQRVGFFEVTVDVKQGQDIDAVSRRLDEVLADFIADGPTADEIGRASIAAMTAFIKQVEPTGGVGIGKANALATGELYANDPDFMVKSMKRYASATPAGVRDVLQRWLTRPVYAQRVDPGPREPYAEAALTRPAPTPAAPLAIAARAAMPEVGTMKPLRFPAVKHARLVNGMRVVYAQSKAVPLSQIAVEFNAGYAADDAAALGTQRLMLDVIAAREAGLDATRLAEAKERLGADITATASMDRSVFTLTTLSANLAPSIGLLASMIRQPAFDQGDIDRQVGLQTSAIAAEQSEPQGMATRVLPALLYGSAHPYGRSPSGLGDAATVTAATRASLVELHRRWIRPDNATVFVVSDKPLQTLLPLLEARFGDWPAPQGAKGGKIFDVAVPLRRSVIVLVDRPQSPQSLILGGELVPQTGQDDRLALIAANESIGATFLSRINQDIREKRGWSYGLFGRLEQRAQRNAYMIFAPVQTSRTGDSIAALIEQYRNFLGTDGVTAAERNRIVGGNIGQLPGSFELSTRILEAMRNNALFGRPDDYWNTVAARYERLSAADMDAAIRSALDAAGFTWVVIGDASLVRPQLESLGLPIETR
ncbi:pitrilysin family protein [soil metagenome]